MLSQMRKKQLQSALATKGKKQESLNLLKSLKDVRTQMRILKDAKLPLIFLSKWSLVKSWLTEYDKVKQTTKGQLENPNAAHISQWFRALILRNHDGASVDISLDMLTTQMSGVSIDETKSRVEKIQSYDKTDGEFVHVDRSELRQVGSEQSGTDTTFHKEAMQNEIEKMKKRLGSEISEKQSIINLISRVEHWAQGIRQSKEVHNKVILETLASDTSNVKDCKKKLQPVIKAVLDSKNDQMNDSLERLSQQCVDSEKKIQILQAEKDDLQTRLSSVAGDKLARGNPAITDLSDPNRPMKISEKYGELYDNEWTDAIECTNKIKSLFPDVEDSQIEEIVIRHLYKILTLCYKECVVLSKKQLQTIGETIIKELIVDEDGKATPNIPGYGEVYKFRRQYADVFAEYLVKEKILTDKLDVIDWQYEHKNAELVQELAATKFMEKCVHLCWYMAIQDPIMHISDEPILDSKFDKNMYKEFVKSGDKVKFAVWPALFLHEGGPLLYKGVAQAYS